MTLPLREISRDSFLNRLAGETEQQIIATGVTTGVPSLFQTFCVVSKRFRKNYIHRFTATNSWFTFSPWNPIRRCCIFLSTNQYFDYVVMATILLNCVFLAMTETVEEAE